jgi:hypothetical protein
MLACMAASRGEGGRNRSEDRCPGNVDRFDLPRTVVETEIDLSLFRAKVTLPQFFS